MIKRVFILLICFAMAGEVAHAEKLVTEELVQEDSSIEELSTNKFEDKTFWTQQIDTNDEWGLWLKEIYKPYSDKMTVAMLKIVASTSGIDFTGKSSEEILVEVNDAYSMSLRSMELIKPPLEFKVYHTKVVELYRQTINTDPKDVEQNKGVIEQLTKEVDQAMTKALKLHGVPERIINYINKN